MTRGHRLSLSGSCRIGWGASVVARWDAKSAPVTVIEVSDILCSHCDFNLNALPGILEDYVAPGKVRYVSHYFGFNSSIQQGAGLAEMCAADQGRYFEFRHHLFQTIAVGDFDIDRAARMAGLTLTLSECVAQTSATPLQ